MSKFEEWANKVGITVRWGGLNIDGEPLYSTDEARTAYAAWNASRQSLLAQLSGDEMMEKVAEGIWNDRHTTDWVYLEDAYGPRDAAIRKNKYRKAAQAALNTISQTLKE